MCRPSDYPPYDPPPRPNSLTPNAGVECIETCGPCDSNGCEHHDPDPRDIQLRFPSASELAARRSNLYTPTCATPNMQDVNRDLAVIARREIARIRHVDYVRWSSNPPKPRSWPPVRTDGQETGGT